MPHWKLPELGADGFGYADARITTRIDATDALPAKIAALRAHGTQVVVGPTERACALSNDSRCRSWASSITSWWPLIAVNAVIGVGSATCWLDWTSGEADDHDCDRVDEL